MPKTAQRVRNDGEDEDINLDAVHVGDRLRVRPGETVPVDGELIEGRSSIDESMVTGESMPVTKEVERGLIGGTLNTTGGFIMRAGKVGSDTMLARIVSMVAEAQRSPSTDPAPGRPGVRLVRSARHRHCHRRFRRLDAGVQAGASLRAWARRCRRRADYQLSCATLRPQATPMSIMVGVGRGAHLGVLVIKNARWSASRGSIPSWSTRPAR